jgi:hypothetical protein
MPRNEQEAFNRYPEDLRTQLKQKKYAQERYEAQQVRFVRFIMVQYLNLLTASETTGAKTNMRDS